MDIIIDLFAMLSFQKIYINIFCEKILHITFQKLKKKWLKPKDEIKGL